MFIYYKMSFDSLSKLTFHIVMEYCNKSSLQSLMLVNRKSAKIVLEYVRAKKWLEYNPGITTYNKVILRNKPKIMPRADSINVRYNFNPTGPVWVKHLIISCDVDCLFSDELFPQLETLRFEYSCDAKIGTMSKLRELELYRIERNLKQEEVPQLEYLQTNKQFSVLTSVKSVSPSNSIDCAKCFPNLETAILDCSYPKISGTKIKNVVISDNYSSDNLPDTVKSMKISGNIDISGLKRLMLEKMIVNYGERGTSIFYKYPTIPTVKYLWVNNIMSISGVGRRLPNLREIHIDKTWGYAYELKLLDTMKGVKKIYCGTRGCYQFFKKNTNKVVVFRG
jgi:hypothetical protein